MEEDDRPVLMTVVRPLAVESRRIVHVPEGVQQIVVRDLDGIVSDLNCLRVTRSTRADLLVSRVVARATLITGNGLVHTRDFVEKMLHAPETAAGKIGFLHRNSGSVSYTHLRAHETRHDLV